MKKDHAEDTVGPWAKRKLDALEAYLRYYNTVLKKQPFQRIYIDAFAGSCISKVRASDAGAEIGPLLEKEDIEAADLFVLGSPLRALQIVEGFHQHFFFDLDPRRAETLNALKKAYSGKRIIVEEGDANILIRRLAEQLHGWKKRGVAFLDPYGAHLEWATVKALAETKNVEVIINFPVAMAINRLITRSGNISAKLENQLNKCFGTDEWRALAYHKASPDLFGYEVQTKNYGVADRLLDLYMSRLGSIFAHVATPRLIRNTKNVPLYYLIWAGPNERGYTGADYILSQGEKVVRRK